MGKISLLIVILIILMFLISCKFWDEKMKFISSILVCLFIVGCDNNSSLKYGEETGAPKNCRAIIKENVDSWRNHKYSAEDVIESIDRNCGEFGISW